MDKKRLLLNIENLKHNQTKKYEECIVRLINKYPSYYKNKEYAKYFKDLD